jgi:hypothetical protein
MNEDTSCCLNSGVDMNMYACSFAKCNNLEWTWRFMGKNFHNIYNFSIITARYVSV